MVCVWVRGVVSEGAQASNWLAPRSQLSHLCTVLYEMRVFRSN
jgi:hypothetical protein